MSTVITWQCTECSNQDEYPSRGGLTLEEFEESNINTMCKNCGAPSYPVDVE